MVAAARSSTHLLEVTMCEHQPQCPAPLAPDHQAARVVAAHPEQGWSLLCNGIILFDDAGEIIPEDRGVLPAPGRLIAAA